ncbi:hypothetical protein BKI52_35345 [marine bacterium AO1-C]|nr:hypothetical protein BKI52_35345 [marine bacterium AO1-C]
MGSRYKIRDTQGLYFVTITVVGWVDLFIRNDYRDCLISSFQYCIKEKGLCVPAYVIMISHIHAILSVADNQDVSAVIRDMKKHTSKELVKLIKNIPESRREWMLNKFSYEAKHTQIGVYCILWKEGYHSKQIETNDFLDEKLAYIHHNPVVTGFVSNPEDFVYSSARNYAGEIGMMPVDLLE